MGLDFTLIAAGAAGALARDLVRDNKLQLPRFSNHCLYLGFLGGMVIGSFVGLLVDHSPLTALLSGYVGTSAIAHLLPQVTDVPKQS